MAADALVRQGISTRGIDYALLKERFQLPVPSESGGMT